MDSPEAQDLEEGEVADTSPKSRYRSKGKSIVVMELPGDLANRDLLHDHFSQFGSVQNMSCSAKHHYAVIQFASHEDAVRAKNEGSVIDPQYGSMKMYLSNKAPSSPAASSSSSAFTSPPQLKRKVSKTSFNTPLKLVNRARKMSSPEDKSGLEKKSGVAMAKLQAAKGLSKTSNIVPVKKRIGGTAGPGAGTFGVIKSTLLSQAADQMKGDKTTAPLFKAVKSSGTSGKTGSVFSSVTTTNAAAPSQDNFLRPPAPQPQQSGRISPVKTPYDVLNFNADTSEAQELLSKKYVTAEERYRALEARDKLLRARIPKVKVSVEFAKKLFGTCPDMCPEKERYMRQFQRQLTNYEVLTEHSDQVDHRKAIKGYSRSSADQEEPLPHELRPSSTLQMTMDYLLHNIVSIQGIDEETLGDWYNFLWDRTRSIRKDLTQQQLTSLESVSLMEKCARFHNHCSSRLCELDVHSFDPKLNDENLMKCLQSLEHLYDDLRKQGVKCPNEPEFRAYQIMMHLNEGDVLSDAQQKPDWIFRSPEVQFALKVHNFVFQKNFVAFFRMVKSSSYMVSCILHRYFYQMRSRALRSLWKAHSCPPKTEVYMSLSGVQRMLGYGDQAAGFRFLCESHGIRCDSVNDRLILNRRTFSAPESRIMSRENHLIESKLKTSIAEAINGSVLGPNPAMTYVPHNSFTDDGFLIPGSIVGGPQSEGSKQTVPFASAPSFPTVSAPSSFFKQPSVSTGGVSMGPFFTNPSITTTTSSAGSNPFGELSKNVFAQQTSSTKSSTSIPSSSVYVKKNIFGSQTISATAAAPIQPVTTSSGTVFKPPPTFSFGSSAASAPQQNLFGGFRTLQQPKQPQQPQQPSAEEVRRQKEQIVQNKAETSAHELIDKYIKKQLHVLSQEALVAVELERKQREQLKEQHKIVEEVLNVYAAKFMDRTVHEIVKQTVQQEVQKNQILTDICRAAANKVLTAIVQKRVNLISKGAIWTHRAELAEITAKLKDIFGRIKLRLAVYKWMKFVEKKKRRREREEERVMRDRLDFPAANPTNLSTEKVLSAFKGAHGKSPRLNKIDGKSAVQWMNIYDQFNSMTEDYSKKLQSIASNMESSAHHSKANLENATPSHSSTVTKAKADLSNYCWKRRWGNNVSEGDDLDDEDSFGETHFKPIKQRREDDGRRANLSLERDSSNSSSSPRSMSPEAKSLLDDMKKFMDEIKKEKKEVNVDIPMDIFDTVTDSDSTTQTQGHTDMEKASSSSGFNFSIPDFSVPLETGEYEEVVQEAELRTPTRTSALLDSLKMFLEETKEEKSKAFLLPPDELDLNFKL